MRKGAGCFVVVLLLAAVLAAQGAVDPKQARTQGLDLAKHGKYVQAIPLLETAFAADPNDVEITKYLGLCIAGQSNEIADPAQRKAARLRARKLLLAARAAGDKDASIDILLEITPEDDRAITFANDPKVDELVHMGEAAFARGDYEGARADYLDAYMIDRHSYVAALYLGDSYFGEKKAADAVQWFEIATQIDPNKETAYRYWGDSLMLLGAPEQARVKYVQAITADPYTRAVWAAFARWGQMTHTEVRRLRLGPPDTIDPASPWRAYETTRARWKDAAFREHFPQAAAYRHSLAEEIEALEQVVAAARNQSPQDRTPQLSALIEIKDQGLLESYVLLDRADEGIAQDFEGYRNAHRDKLEEYVNEWLIVRPAKQ